MDKCRGEREKWDAAGEGSNSSGGDVRGDRGGRGGVGEGGGGGGVVFFFKQKTAYEIGL